MPTTRKRKAAPGTSSKDELEDNELVALPSDADEEEDEYIDTPSNGSLSPSDASSDEDEIAPSHTGSTMPRSRASRGAAKEGNKRRKVTQEIEDQESEDEELDEEVGLGEILGDEEEGDGVGMGNGEDEVLEDLQEGQGGVGLEGVGDEDEGVGMSDGENTNGQVSQKVSDTTAVEENGGNVVVEEKVEVEVETEKITVKKGEGLGETKVEVVKEDIEVVAKVKAVVEPVGEAKVMEQEEEL